MYRSMVDDVFENSWFDKRNGSNIKIENDDLSGRRISEMEEGESSLYSLKGIVDYSRSQLGSSVSSSESDCTLIMNGDMMFSTPSPSLGVPPHVSKPPTPESTSQSRLSVTPWFWGTCDTGLRQLGDSVACSKDDSCQEAHLEGGRYDVGG